ncbi:MAG: ABC transporter permease [Betaproteobacteria bacterium]
MFELSLALKNLRRNRRRTLLTAAVLAFGVLLYAFSNSLYAGFEADSLKVLVQHETGEVSLTARGYWEEREELPLAPVIPNAAEVAVRARQVPGVEGAVPRVVFSALVNNGLDELPVKAIGTDPRHDSSVLALHKGIAAGRYLKPGREEAVLGRGVAKLMDLRIGDTFTLILRNRGTSFEAVDLTVVGLLNTPDAVVNEGCVYLPLDVAQRLTGLGTAATEIVVAGQGGYTHAPVLRDRLASALSREEPSLDFHTWEASAAVVLETVKSKQSAMGLIIGFIMILAGLGVTNNVLLAGFERTREIGTLRALGLTEAQVTRVFMFEGLGVGFLGGLLGAGAGALAVSYLVQVGLDFSRVLGGDTSLGLPALTVRGVWNLPTILAAWVAVTVFCYLISYLPARRAGRLDPATALRQ